MSIISLCVLLLTVTSSVKSKQDNLTNEILKGFDTKNIESAFSQINMTLLGSLTEKILLPNGQSLDDWVPPADFSKRFVYYLAGYDEDNRPVYMAEIGRWNVQKVIEDGLLREFDLFVKQSAHLGIKSIKERSTEEVPVEGALMVLDFAELKMNQVRHYPTVKYILGLAHEFQKLANRYLGEAIIINANYAAETLMNLVKPILGGLFERITVYGNNKAQWVPKLLRSVPRKYVPEWYGGSKDFQPVKIYG